MATRAIDHTGDDMEAVLYTAAYAVEQKGVDPVSPDIARKVFDLCYQNQIDYYEKHFKLSNEKEKQQGRLTAYLGSQDKSNFRFKVATTKAYKSERGTRPYHYDTLYDYIANKYRAKIVSGMESDDALGIQSQEFPGKYIIRGEDKDLRNIYNTYICWKSSRARLVKFEPNKKPNPFIINGAEYYLEDKEEQTHHTRKPFFTGEPGYWFIERSSSGGAELFATGIFQLAYQLLHGDSSDSIPPLESGWGPVKVSEFFSSIKIPHLLLPAVMDEFQRVLGSDQGLERYWEQYKLVKILTQKGEHNDY